MGERDQLERALRRLDAGQAGRPDDVALRGVAARDRRWPSQGSSQRATRRPRSARSPPWRRRRPSAPIPSSSMCVRPGSSPIPISGFFMAPSPPPRTPPRPRHLLLPDRRLGLDAVDRLARAGEGLAAVRGRNRDDHARLAQRDVADAVLGGDRLQIVCLGALAEDLGDSRLGHLGVGVVCELFDVAGRALERDDRAGARIADERCDGRLIERLGDSRARPGPVRLRPTRAGSRRARRRARWPRRARRTRD